MAVDPIDVPFLKTEITNLTKQIGAIQASLSQLRFDFSTDQFNKKQYDIYTDFIVDVETERRGLDGKFVDPSEEITDPKIDAAAEGQTNELFPLGYTGIDTFPADGLLGGTGNDALSEQNQLSVEDGELSNILGVIPPTPPVAPLDLIIYNNAKALVISALNAQISDLTAGIAAITSFIPKITGEIGPVAFIAESTAAQAQHNIALTNANAFLGEANSDSWTVASINARKSYISTRNTEVSSRVSQIVNFLGDINNEQYNTRYNYLNFRIRRSGGTLRTLKIKDQSDSQLQDEVAFKTFKRDFYRSLLP